MTSRSGGFMRSFVVGVVGAVIAASSGACSSEIVGDDDDDGGGGGAVTLAFTTPTAGASFTRDTVEPTLGWLAADVTVELAIGGAPATVDLAAGDVALTTSTPGGLTTLVLPVHLIAAGPTTLTATARDAGGAVVATATVDVEVVEPEVADCHGWLDLYGATYVVSAPRDGVADGVTLTTPINGMPYRYLGNANVRPTFFMDCSLARSLLEAAPHLRARGVVEVTDIGVYNYRCIGGEGTPPDCPRGMSQHAYAKAIDIAGVTTADGTYYSVEDDWVIDPAAEPTCAAATADDKDAFLHDAICALKGGDVWNIVLTPNYNADHRNHFHVDLTEGSDFIRKLAAAGLDVDTGEDHH